MMRLATAAVLVACAFAVVPSAIATPILVSGARSNCSSMTGARADNGGFSDYSGKSCRVGNTATGPSSDEPKPVTRVVDCGPRQVAGQQQPRPGDACGEVRYACDVYSAAQLPTDPKATTEATLRRYPDGSWALNGINCVARAAAPQVTPLLVLAQVRRLVPHPKIGVAPPGGTTLVNIQTLLWLDTPADQSLGTVTLLGHRIALRVHVDRADWDFGDGQSDTTDSPERKYDPADHCHTVICPDYWGHVYDTTGRMTITATVTWSGRYRVDGGSWQDVPDTVNGSAASTHVTVRQARGVLVPDPGSH